MNKQLIGISIFLSLITVLVIVFLFMSCTEKNTEPKIITVNGNAADSVGNIILPTGSCDTIYIHDTIYFGDAGVQPEIIHDTDTTWFYK